ncbi:hypothetical protein AKJ66_01270 [candidate division MSBL1 archaeon SCGC-AAA259E22]|uniref:Peptidase S8/S53 domain-containing protein n=2 Tax=candidate division MSBL1 TaxID=215777 RepID=A0A133UHX0_9EURY|nr:hypothetical protein AKJ66_01270 [candidate division MSBL1 archaeon SCGC-AAA259E22]
MAVNIGFEDEVDRGLVERHGGEITKELTQINVVAAEVPEQAVRPLGQNPNVEFVEEDGTMYALDQVTPWGVDRIDADVVIDDDATTAEESQIAIVDTGIDPNHGDLDVAGGYAIVKARGPYDKDWADDSGHGTHVAGTATALNNGKGVVGVAPEIKLYAVKVLDKSGRGSFSDVAAGIEWSAEQGHDVISLSLGSTNHSDTVERAVNFAYGEGSLVVSSAGNEYGGQVTYPAAYENAVAVSAIDEDDGLADFSSTGEEVELAAPGVDIYSTYPDDDYKTMSGTSMAAPHVSGAAAYLMAEGMSNVEAREQLKDTAEDIGLDDDEQGAGLVDVAAAVGVEVETGALEGTVTDISDNPIEGATVEIVDTGDTTETNESGEYSFEEVSTGEHDVTASKDGYYSKTKKVTIEEGVINQLDFSLEETEDAAPVIESFVLSDTSNPAWARVEVDWAVSDEDGDLDNVKLEVLDGKGNVTTKKTIQVSGSGASGVDELKEKGAHDSFVKVRIVVSDAAGNTTSKTKEI